MATLDQAISKMRAEDEMAWEPGSEWRQDDIEKLERETGLTVPASLRAFLLQYGVVGSEQYGGFKITFPSGNVGYTEIQLVGDPDVDDMIKSTRTFLEHRYGENKDKVLPARVPPGYIFFGTAEGNRSYLLMKGDGSGDEAVYHWGLAYDPWMEGDNRTGIGYVAPSLADFLINLKPMAELD